MIFPEQLLTVVVTLVSWIAYVSKRTVLFIPYVQSFDYLLRVTLQEHTFRNNVDEIEFEEESIESCFRRRMALLNRTQRR